MSAKMNKAIANSCVPPGPALELMLDDEKDIRMPFQKIELDRFLFNGMGVGEFPMGSRGYDANEEPVHKVRLSRDFYLGTTPVTVEQYGCCPLVAGQKNEAAAQQPATHVNWNDAREYCSWLTEKCDAQIPDGFTPSLPAEAQWEFACRAGTETDFYTGDGDAALW